MQHDTETLAKFAEAIAKKLREMKISQAFHPGVSEAKGLFKRLLRCLESLKELKADIASADSLPIREDMRTAAKRVAQQTYQNAEQNAVSYVITILGHCYWEMADVVAKALAYEMTTTKGAKKAIARGDNASAEEIPLRYFLHVVLDGDCGTSDFFSKVVDGWVTRFGETAVLYDFGWLQGSIRASNSGGSSDGAFFIVRVKDIGKLASLVSWLGELGAVSVSTPEMVDVSLLYAESTPASVPES